MDKQANPFLSRLLPTGQIRARPENLFQNVPNVHFIEQTLPDKCQCW